MTHYTVTDLNRDDAPPCRIPAEPEGEEEWATDVEDAACMWAERNVTDEDEALCVRVVDPSGKAVRVTVHIERVCVFTGLVEGGEGV